MKTFLQKHIDDILIIGGEMLIVAGIYHLFPDWTLISAGIAVVIDGVLVGIGGSRR
jgi:hypothetical protein